MNYPRLDTPEDHEVPQNDYLKVLEPVPKYRGTVTVRTPEDHEVSQKTTTIIIVRLLQSTVKYPRVSWNIPEDHDSHYITTPQDPPKHYHTVPRTTTKPWSTPEDHKVHEVPPRDYKREYKKVPQSIMNYPTVPQMITNNYHNVPESTTKNRITSPKDHKVP